jgi:hypothetical protein
VVYAHGRLHRLVPLPLAIALTWSVTVGCLCIFDSLVACARRIRALVDRFLPCMNVATHKTTLILRLTLQDRYSDRQRRSLDLDYH